MNEELGKGTREVQTIVGKGGNGKTTLLRQLLGQSKRSLVFDPLGIMYPGLVVLSRADLETFVDECGDNPRFRVIYRPQVDEADHAGMGVEAEFFCWVGRNVERCELYFDEVDAFYRSGDKPPELLALLNFGRNHEVTMRGVVRRPQVKMPQDWMSETTRLTMFCVTKLQDLYMLESATGVGRDDIRSLVPFEFIEWHEGAIKRSKLRNPYA